MVTLILFVSCCGWVGSEARMDQHYAQLTDKSASFAERRSAAVELGEMGGSSPMRNGWPVPYIEGNTERSANAVIDHFKSKSPTAAEAILQAMDEELAALDAKERENASDDPPSESEHVTSEETASTRPTSDKPFTRDQIEVDYVYALRELNDNSVAKEISTRSKQTTSQQSRLRLAELAEHLGDTTAMETVAADLRAGNWKIEDDFQGQYVVHLAIWVLVNSKTEEADAALDAMSQPKHPHYAMIKQRVLVDFVHEWVFGDWEHSDFNMPESRHFQHHKISLSMAPTAHPFCLPILRAELDNLEKTGVSHQVTEKGKLHTSFCTKKYCAVSMGELPEILKDPSVRKTEADERRCDVAATLLARKFKELPRVHPLQLDVDKRLEAYREYVDRILKQ